MQTRLACLPHECPLKNAQAQKRRSAVVGVRMRKNCKAIQTKFEDTLPPRWVSPMSAFKADQKELDRRSIVLQQHTTSSLITVLFGWKLTKYYVGTLYN